jgi:hypothetical protein
MGVICVSEEKPSSRLQALFESGNVIALFEKSSSGEVALRAKDVLRLINFLHRVVRSYQMRAALAPFVELRTTF